MARRTAANALAFHFGWDVGEMKEYRYQPTRTSVPIFSIEDSYYCALKIGKNPPKDEGFPEWKPLKDNLLEQEGWQIWEATSGEEEE